MNEFISGAVFALCCVAGLYFLRFWRRTRDRFFALFAISFWLMALQRVVALCLAHTKEELAEAYLIRLLAFTLILVAIVDKNRTRRGPSRKQQGPS